MTDRIVKTPADLTRLLRFLENHALPFTATITAGEHRTNEQNKLQRKWVSEIAQQFPDAFESPEHARAYCKLHVGIPLLREVNEAFRLKYDRLLKDRSYEEKLEFMMVPISLPVTSIMTVKQKSEYLNRVFRHFSQKGAELTIPPDARYEDMRAAA